MLREEIIEWAKRVLWFFRGQPAEYARELEAPAGDKKLLWFGATMARAFATASIICVVLFCAGCGGGGTSAPVPRLPAVDIAITPALVTPGQESILTWSSTNADSCNASGAWSGPQQTSGTQKVSQAGVGNYAYQLECTGTGGSTSASAALSITTLSIKADASQTGPAMNSDQLGANLNIGFPDISDPTYIPLWNTAGIGLFRWPGGLLSDYYHWRTHSYGPCSPFPNPPAATAFDTWMQAIPGPMNANVAVTVNYGSNATCTGPADPNEAADWVDHANNIQRYGVKYWTVGNEEYLSGEPDLSPAPHDPLTYANRVASEFYPLMKAKDPSILVGIDLAFGNLTFDAGLDAWDPIVLANSKYDFVELHYYPEHNNVDDDDALLTHWADQAATNFSTAKSLLAASGHEDTPIFLGEFDRDSGGSAGPPGHENVSIVNALFTAIVIGEATNAGIKMTAAWTGIDLCWPDSLSSPVSTAYGQQNYGSFGLFAGSGSGFSFSCVDQAAPKGTPFPKGRAFEILHQYVKSGETPIAVVSSDSAVRVYAATNGNGYSILIVNINSSASHDLPVTIQNASESSFTATSVVYGKSEYDLSAGGNWAGLTAHQLGTVGATFDISLPPWSVTLVKLQ